MKVKVTSGWHTLCIRTVNSTGLPSGRLVFPCSVGPMPTAPDVPGSLQLGGIDTAAPMLSGVITTGTREVMSGERGGGDVVSEGGA